VSSNGPSHLQVRMGIALRQARTDLGLSQTEAAALVERTQGWLQKIEKALNWISPGDLEKLLPHYKLPDDQAAELRRMLRSKHSTEAYVEAGSNPDWWQKLQEVELTARVIKAVHLQAHDGLIQSEAYMRRQFELGGGVDLEGKVEARLARQHRVLDQHDPPEATFVLEEACLHTDMGDRAMMAIQIEHLLAVSERPHVTILVKPFNALFPAAPYGFTMVQFDSAVMRDFVSIEYEISAATIDDETDVRRFQHRWETIRSAALSQYASRDLLRSKLAGYRRTTEEPQDP
jgi:transcriptional regulator with XRE-family HTH domain